MAETTNRSVSIYIDQTAAQVALEQLQKKADQLTRSITQGQAAGRNMSQELRRLADTQSSITAVQNALDRGLRPSLVQQENLVRQLRNELRRMSEDAPGYAQRFSAFRNATQELDRMNASMRSVHDTGQTMLTKAGAFVASFTANLASQAVNMVANGVRSLFSMNAAFEASLKNLSAITGATGTDLDYLKNQAIELSKQGKQSATDYVEAFKLIASAKPELLSQKESLVEVTKAAKLLADAAGLELPDAATRLTDALNQFGAPAQEAGKYVDALAAASKYGAAEVPEVTEALLKFGSQAKSANIDIYESAAAIELMAEKGIKGAEAGTQLRNVFLAMNAVDALPKTALAALDAAGVKTDVLKDKSLSLEERLKELSKIQNNATAIVQVFGKENSNAAQILLQGLPRYAQLTAQVKEQGVAQKAAATNTDTLSNAWEKFKNTLSANFLTGSNSFLKDLVTGLTKMVEPAKTAAQQMESLGQKVQHLNNDIVPLANRYDELKKKTNLNTAEQSELKSIISQLSAAMPGAISQFDAYGNAIAINTDRVRGLAKAEADRLKYVNQQAIADAQSDLNEVNKKIAELQQKRNEMAAKGSFTVYETDSAGYLKKRQSTNDENSDLENQYQDLKSQQSGIGSQLDQLRGKLYEDQAKTAEVIKQLKDLQKQYKEGTKEYLTLQEEINKIQGIGSAAPAAPAGDDGSSNKNDAKEDKKREDLLKKLREFQFELQQIGKQSDESEIERIKHKYAELTKGAGQAIADQIKLEKDKNAAIAFLLDEEVRKRQAASDKAFKANNAAEYDQALQDSATYFENLREQQAQSFATGQIDQQQYQANIRAIDIAAAEAQVQTAEDYSATVDKAAGDVTRFKKGQLDKQVADHEAALAKMKAAEQLLAQINKDGAIARAQHAVNTSAPGSQARLEAEKNFLKVQESQEIEAVNKRETEAQKLGIQYDQEFNDMRSVISDKYRQEEQQKEIDHYTALAGFVLDYASQALSVISQFNDNKNRQEQKALDAELKTNDKKKTALDKQLKQRTISQQQYNIEVARLDADADKKKEDLERKQFNRKKKQDTIQALIDVSKAITTDISHYGAPIPPNFLSMAAVGFDIAIGGAKVAAIQGQQYAEGGLVTPNGRINTTGNIPAQPNGDNVLATIKTGEVVLNEEQQQKAGGAAFFRSIGVPGFASGGVIKPAYQSRSYQAINFEAATRSIVAAKQFASGGIVTTNQGASSNSDLLQHLAETKQINEQLMQTNLQVVETLTALNSQLNKGIKAEVPLKQITDAQDTKNRILQEATFK